jgi:UDP-N-acetylglucosamine--N-acetylmuramyl-(pentapeptide) pyrophosphoryl-undecaprenol N-acetylglucosamine transferase
MARNFTLLIYILRFAFSPIILAYFLTFKFFKNFRKNSTLSIVTTGGTAGHIFPAIRLCGKAVKLNKNIHFVSNEIGKNLILKLGKVQNGNFTYTEHKDENYKPIAITFLPICPVNLKKMPSMFQFGISMFLGLLIVLRRGAVLENVVGFGGYASFPMLFWASVFCKKIYIHEQNVVLGAVNELFLPFATKIFTAFPTDIKKLNCHYVGMPLSHNLEKQTPHKHINLRGKIRILIISGSSGGTEAMNSIIPAIILLSKKHKNLLHIYHQVHSAHIASVKNKYLEHEISATVEPFFENIHELLPQIDLCISRPGACSIVDLLCFGVTTIFLPLKHSARNHQMKNAAWVVSNKAGFMYKPWESNVYNFAALMAFCLTSANENGLSTQNVIKKNARGVMCNTIWS